MDNDEISLDRRTRAQFILAVRYLVASGVGRKALILFGLLILLLLGTNGLNVVNSYVGRDFISAIEHRDAGRFAGQAVLYLGVFALSTLTAVYCRYTEERLGLLWREWLTRQLICRYLEHPTYYRLSDKFAVKGEIQNPDQRIAEDVKAFTTMTLSLVLLGLNGAFTILAFAGVLWSISPVLFGVAVAYSVLGTYLAMVLGRPLVRLNYAQLDKEASFRTALVQLRENAESIALLRREGRVEGRILGHFEQLAANFERIVRVNRDLGFFTTGYNYLIQIIPALIVAPMFMRGEAEFGVITQSAMAFAYLLGAFSLVVTQFQSLSSFAAAIARLGSLIEGMERVQAVRPSAIEVRSDESRLGYEGLTLRMPDGGNILIADLSISIPTGTRVLAVCTKETPYLALFRATAGLWDAGEGCIIRPEADRIMFLPERPYLPPGTLRELLLPTGQERRIADKAIDAALASLHLEPVVERAGSLDVERPWESIFSPAEQQLVAFARLLLASPRFAMLDRLHSTLPPEQVARLLRMLDDHSITYINFGELAEPLHRYDATLELLGDGRWTWKPRVTPGTRPAPASA